MCVVSGSGSPEQNQQARFALKPAAALVISSVHSSCWTLFGRLQQMALVSAVSLAAVAGHACYKLVQHVPSAVPVPEQPCFIQFLNAELPMLKGGVIARSPVPVSKAWIACQPIQVVKIPIVSRMVRHWFVVFKLEDPGQCLYHEGTPFHYPYLRVERQAATEGSEAVLTMRFAKDVEQAMYMDVYALHKSTSQEVTSKVLDSYKQEVALQTECELKFVKPFNLGSLLDIVGDVHTSKSAYNLQEANCAWFACKLLHSCRESGYLAKESYDVLNKVLNGPRAAVHIDPGARAVMNTRVAAPAGVTSSPNNNMAAVGGAVGLAAALLGAGLIYMNTTGGANKGQVEEEDADGKQRNQTAW